MKIPASFVDELRSRLLTSDVIRKRVALKKNGREYGGLCPFHKEKTPSFSVNDEKGFYHCFGCGAHGDIIKFVMETEGLSFFEAVENLAPKAGLAVPKPDAASIQKEKKALELRDVNAMATEWFCRNLYEEIGKGARNYLQKRGLNRKIAEKFRLGFAPDDWRGLIAYLKGKAVPEKMILDAGLAIKNEKGDIYDRFRGRVMFPISDFKGSVIAFGGRILGEGSPKYLNSPETALFHKGYTLYNENNARRAATEKNQLIVVEGYMDVIALDAAGISNAVAPLGTAVTVNQIQRMWSMCREPVMCMDGDNAGQRSMLRAAETCLPILKPDHSLKFAVIPDGFDPDDFIRQRGAENFGRIIDKARPLAEVVFISQSKETSLTTPEQIAGLEKRLNVLSEKIENKAVSGYYKNFFRQKLWDLQKSNRLRGNLTKQGVAEVKAEIGILPKYDPNSLEGIEEAVIVHIIKHQMLLDDFDIKEEFAHLKFSSNELDKLRDVILQIYDDIGKLSKKDMVGELERAGITNYIYILGNLDSINNQIDIEKIKFEWQYNIYRYRLCNLRKECSVMQSSMTEDSEQKVAEFINNIFELEQEISRMEIAFGDV